MAITRLLVANRGEIACRIFRTCDRLGVDTVAVAEPKDRRSLHALSAAQTIEIPSYLDLEALIGAAREARADAVHPGYGFLAESPAARGGRRGRGSHVGRAIAGGDAPRR